MLPCSINLRSKTEYSDNLSLANYPLCYIEGSSCLHNLRKYEKASLFLIYLLIKEAFPFSFFSREELSDILSKILLQTSKRVEKKVMQILVAIPQKILQI